jgi:hypothetical protein
VYRKNRTEPKLSFDFDKDFDFPALSPLPNPTPAFRPSTFPHQSTKSASSSITMSEINVVRNEMQAKSKLTDVYRHRHGLDEPATYQRGHRRLDYILCTSSLLPAITACGILPFKLLSESDHRTVYVDFDTHSLFGSLPSELASPKQQPFHSRDYENSEVYINTVHAYCEDHDLYQRSEAALTSSSPSELNKLDAAVGRAMQAGIKAVTKRYRTPFTPAMRQARLSRHFYNLHMQQYKQGQSRICALAKISRIRALA